VYRLILESYATVNEQAKITGIAATPRISRNGILYTKAELERADGMTVPLNWEHDGSKVIGTATYSYNPQLEQLFYSATVTDEGTASLIKNKQLFTSIEAEVADIQSICNGPQDCFQMPIGLNFIALALTENPGIPETTVRITERFVGVPPHMCSKHTGTDTQNSSLSANLAESKVTMTSKEQECPPGQKPDPENPGECMPAGEKAKEQNIGNGPDDEAAGIDQAKPSVGCPEGMQMGPNGECEPASNDDSGSPVSTLPESKKPCGCSEAKPQSGHGMPNMDMISSQLKEQKQMIEEVKERVNNPTQLSELEEMQKFNKKLYSTTKLSPQNGTSFAASDLQYIAKEGVSALKKYHAYSFDMDMSQKWVKEHLKPRGVIQEAIALSGQSNVDAAMDDVFVLPGGKYLKSIRDLVKFVEIPDGQDTANLFKGDIPNNQAITEGAANTAGTHTVTTVPLTADAVTGVPQTITQSQLEDTPVSLFDYIAQTARAEVLEHEASLVFDTTAIAATPGFTGGNAAAIFDHTHVADALEYWEDQGYNTEFGNAYIALSPKALKELRVDPALTRFVQTGDANITKTGRLTHLYGVELVPMNALNTTTNEHAIGGIKGVTFALGSKRELTIDMHKVPNQSAFDWAWTQRKGAVAFDEASLVELESLS